MRLDFHNASAEQVERLTDEGVGLRDLDVLLRCPPRKRQGRERLCRNDRLLQAANRTGLDIVGR